MNKMGASDQVKSEDAVGLVACFQKKKMSCKLERNHRFREREIYTYQYQSK